MPGSSGGKTSSSTSSQSSPYAPILAAIGSQMWNTAKPVSQTYANQANEALKTGGVNANIPSINASVDASRQSSSQSETQLRQRLAQSGLAGTPFAQNIMAQQQGTDNARTGAIPADATQAFISQAVPTVLNEGNAGIGALGTAGGLDINTKSTSTPSFWDTFMQGAGIGATAFAGA